MMMWHHCFLSGRFTGYTISFYPLIERQVVNIATFFKICVSLFAFVSGYGLYVSFYRFRNKGKSQVQEWIKRRYCKTFKPYQFIVLLTWLVTMLIDKRPVHVYFNSTAVSGIAYMILDYLGIAHLFGTPQMIGTWWYMSAAFVYIMIMPLVYTALESVGSLSLLTLVIAMPRFKEIQYPGTMGIYTFLPAYLMGAIFAKHELFQHISQLVRTRKRYVIVLALCIFGTYIGYRLLQNLPVKKFWDIHYGLFIPVYVCLIWLSVCQMALLKRAFCFLGQHSANIFLTHTFIRAVYLKDFIYTRGHFLLIMLTLLGLSVFLSLAIEKAENLCVRIANWCRSKLIKYR